ncbi:NAD(P)/FAD-dependent oxidoreductase [uncultured Aquincola sp.]|uniref:NAD(P)/FAD-dependent oxidoreductase n=1 Tax=uncultured Aquincola sp. TaxID=886556 RepID=UPI0032B26825
MLHSYDAIILGAGAAGLHCAAMAGQMGARVLLLDHAAKVAEKIRISGGGRCNFTNRDTTPAQFLSDNPHFCRSALSRYTPQDFIALLQRHGIGFHEKHRGQLFCDEGSERIIDMLLAECEAGSVERWQPCVVRAVRHGAAGYEVDTDRGTVGAPRLVVATGGLSIPKIGATDFGHRLARQFGHRIVEPRPALVPLTFPAQQWAPFAALAGLSLEVLIDAGTGKKRTRFLEDLLFTHRGLSGPAVLQVSSYWRPGEPITIDLAPGRDLAAELKAAKARSKRQLGNELAALLPQRLADTWVQRQGLDATLAMPQARDRDLEALGASLGGWQLQPDGSEGWRKAEVTAGGVDTRELNQQTMESRLQPGLHFIGEVTDVTGWLGGYNFQWAWASAAACASALAAHAA